MTEHTKARLWALAGLTPVILLATWIGGPAALLVFAVLGWAWVTAVLSEHAWQTPSVRWLEKRNAQLEQQKQQLQERLFATEAAMKAMARASSDHGTVVVDLRQHGTLTRAAGQRQTELRRRLEETAAANERARLHAEPTPEELAEAKTAIAEAFEPYDAWGDPR